MKTTINKILEMLRNRKVVVPFLVFVGVLWATQFNTLSPDMETESQKILDELRASSPENRAILAGMKNELSQRSLQLAALSVGGQRSQASLINEMASEMRTTRRLPHQARLAAIMDQKKLLLDSDRRESFLLSHAMACQAIASTDGPQTLNDYLSGLESAASSPKVWGWVQDDPLALFLWTHGVSDDLLAYYHKERDWLGGPLLEIEPTLGDGGEARVHSDLIGAAMKWPNAAMALLKNNEFGGLGLGILAKHGDLIDQCQTVYAMDPAEVCAVLYVNPDRFPSTTNPGDVRATAALLAQIKRDSSAVWLSAMNTPLALRLQEDAPDVANQLFNQFGVESLPILIYSFGEERKLVRRIAASIVRWGDGAIFVLSKYRYRREEIREMFLHEEMGNRTVPFLMKYEDKAFKQFQNDPAWGKKYFEENGSPKKDSWDFLEGVPGGSAVLVCKSWANGEPCEWEELGWAAVDVIDAALLISSLGTTAPASAARRATAQASKLAAKKLVKRRVAKQAWKEAVESVAKVFKRGGKSARPKNVLKSRSLLARASGKILKISKVGMRVGGRVLVAGYKVSRAVGITALTPIRLGVGVWRKLPLRARKLIARALVVAVTFAIFRKLPKHLAEIGRKIGEFIGEVGAGAVKMLANTLAGACEAFVRGITGSTSRTLSQYGPMIFMFLLAGLFWIQKRPKHGVVKLK